MKGNNSTHVFEFLTIPGLVKYHLLSLRPPQGVCEAHLHQANKHCVIGANLVTNLWECMVGYPPYVPIDLWWNCSSDTMFVCLWPFSPSIGGRGLTLVGSLQPAELHNQGSWLDSLLCTSIHAIDQFISYIAFVCRGSIITKKLHFCGSNPALDYQWISACQTMSSSYTNKMFKYLIFNKL